MNVLKWAENILENVDQTARTTVEKAKTPGVPASMEQKFKEELQKMDLFTEENNEEEKELQQKIQNALSKETKKEIIPEVSSTSSSEAAKEKAAALTPAEIEKLAQENEMLKQNMTALHDEVRDLTNLTKNLSEKYKKAQGQMKKQETYTVESRERLENQVSRLLQEKMTIDQEFQSTLEQKEKQQKQLELKIEELIKQLRSKDSLVMEIQSERDKQVNDGLRNAKQKEAELSAIRKQAEDLEQLLTEEREKHRITRVQAESRENILLKEKTDLEEEYANLQESMNQKAEEIARLESSIKLRESEWKIKDKELQEHKQRAAKVLQQKDKQIEQLEQKLKSDNTEQNAEQSAESKAENNEEGEDNTFFQNKNTLLSEIETLRSENQELLSTIELLKRQQESEVSASRLKIRNSEKTIEKERSTVAKLQQTITSLRLTLDQTRQLYESEKKELQDTIKTKTAQVKQLQEQIEKASNLDNQSELEARCRVMAEHLLEKQAQIETLNSEKSALKLQLEKSLGRIKEVELMSRLTPAAPVIRNKGKASGSIHIEMNQDGEGEEEELPMVPRVKSQKFFHDLSKRGFLARNLASGLNVLDRISIQSAKYLRLPLLRVVFVFYIILIHIWVFFVLFSTTNTAKFDLPDTPIEKITQAQQ